jgi:hypothetical protein
MDRKLFCAQDPPQWLPDGQHFLYFQDGHWQLGNVKNSTIQELNFLDSSAGEADWLPGITWINDEYFLLSLRSFEASSLSVATLDGIIAQVFLAPAESWPQFSYSLND